MKLVPWKKNWSEDVPFIPPTHSQQRYYQYFCEELMNGNRVEINEYTNYIQCYFNNCVRKFMETKNFYELLQDTKRYDDIYEREEDFDVYFTSLKTMITRDDAIYYLNDKKLAREYYMEYKTNENKLGKTLFEIRTFFSFFKSKPNNVIKTDDVQLAINIGNYLTDFGKEHFINMKPLINKELESYRKEHGENLLYSIFKPYLFKSDRTLFRDSPNKMNKKVLECRVSPTHELVSKPLGEFFRNCENLYRDYLNLPRIGQGWLNETLLYERIKAAFPKLEVIQHGSPEFLKPQHLDVYIPYLKLGIEYQGDQHFKAVDFFGGEEGLLKTKQRDILKKEKMSRYNYDLIEVLPNYKLEEVLQQITQVGEKQNVKVELDIENLKNFNHIETELAGKRKLKTVKN